MQLYRNGNRASECEDVFRDHKEGALPSPPVVDRVTPGNRHCIPPKTISSTTHRLLSRLLKHGLDDVNGSLRHASHHPHNRCSRQPPNGPVVDQSVPPLRETTLPLSVLRNVLDYKTISGQIFASTNPHGRRNSPSLCECGTSMEWKTLNTSAWRLAHEWSNGEPR